MFLAPTQPTNAVPRSVARAMHERKEHRQTIPSKSDFVCRASHVGDWAEPETGWNGLITKREDGRTYGTDTYLLCDQQIRRTRVLFEEYDILFSRQLLPMTNWRDIERCEQVREDLQGISIQYERETPVAKCQNLFTRASLTGTPSTHRT